MDTKVYSKDVRLAAAAYKAALGGRWDAATRYVERISVECGGVGLNKALMAWCDLYHDHATDGDMAAASAKMSFVQTSTGALGGLGSPDVPVRIQWAGRLIAARVAMDEAGWAGLIAEMPSDGFEIGRYVSAVLECAVLTINGLPRGFARMGRG